jgi:hypothetical protein
VYFIKTGGKVCHILENEFVGRAPDPCGSKAEQLDLIKYNAGEPTAGILTDKPATFLFASIVKKA